MIQYLTKKMKLIPGSIISFFFVTIFLLVGGCHPSPRTEALSSLTKSEAQDLEAFLNFLLFENYGAFVLFGSKPLVMFSLISPEEAARGWEETLAAMPEEERRKWEAITRREVKEACKMEDVFGKTYAGWLVWKKFEMNINYDRYFLNVTLEKQGSGSYRLLFGDRAKLAVVLAEHYDLFKDANGGEDFDPVAIMYQIEDPNSIFWNRVFALENHLTKGLLFGFGKKNSLLFHYRYKHQDDPSPLSKKIMEMPMDLSFSKLIAFGESNLKNFAVPRFGVVDMKRVERYRKEKALIEEYYKGKSLIDATIQRWGLAAQAENDPESE